ncbi:hypothetical protein RUM43_007705 [Polyplax serrata]|uniref:Secreted protein n=1 Tax=Polyplax serrata TaxID=468196 RepID=A0AAN8PN59_POLSC
MAYTTIGLLLFVVVVVVVVRSSSTPWRHPMEDGVKGRQSVEVAKENSFFFCRMPAGSTDEPRHLTHRGSKSEMEGQND